MKKITLLIAPLMFTLGSCNSNESQLATPTPETDNVKQGQAFLKTDEGTGNILQIAVGSEAHSTLVAAVQAAQIENVLANNGPITVFAPHNEAFAALPEGTVDDLLKPENKAKLAKIITHHASPGTFKAEALKDGLKMYMATGEYLNIKNNGSDVFIEDAKIVGTIEASNGVIHVIDKVLLPKKL